MRALRDVTICFYVGMDKKKNHKRGRPLKINDSVLSKLEYAYSIGCNDIEACSYADVSLSCLHRYLNSHNDFRERRDTLKNKPVLQAKQNVYDSLKYGDAIMTRWYLEKKCPSEFGNKAELNVTTSGTLDIESRSDALNGFLSKFLIE